jgi:hypothetical protein
MNNSISQRWETGVTLLIYFAFPFGWLVSLLFFIYDIQLGGGQTGTGFPDLGDFPFFFMKPEFIIIPGLMMMKKKGKGIHGSWLR